MLTSQDQYIVGLPSSAFMDVYWKKLQMANPVTTVLADRAKNIVQRLEFFDQYSKPLAKMDLTESEKTHYLRVISLDYFGRFYLKQIIA
ncbi:hypothetical protein [Desulfosporosinus sp. OT]|uniref:hypothetical protein n=1 Tax=Desulfosporosinus sp. OT TaxID=913865 RepID=UPI001300BF7D|nr:hypothetical protein [Desulfosporosinus sp. OT]